jgi:hypothetical protein
MTDFNVNGVWGKYTPTHLQSPPGIHNRVCHLSDSTGDKEARGDDTNDRGKRENLLDNFGEEFVECHADGNGSQYNLSRRDKQNIISVEYVVLSSQHSFNSKLLMQDAYLNS